MSNINLKKGHLLIAEPSIIGDLSFNRSIIIMQTITRTALLALF